MSGVELKAGHLSRAQIVGLAVASMIPAVGLASVPALNFTSAGNSSALASLIAAVVTAAVGLCVITFARRHVATGALYSYLSVVFGPWAKLLSAAALLLGYTAMVAGITMVIGVYFGSFLLSVGISGGLDLPVQICVYAASMLIAVTCVRRGLDVSVRTAVILMCVSVPVVAVVVIASAATTGLQLADQFSFGEGFSASGVFQGMAAGTAFLVGFESCTALALETKDPKRNIPIAVLGIPIVLGVVYFISTLMQVPGLFASSEALSGGASPAAALALNAGLGDGFAQATDLVLAVATFAGLIGFVNFGSRFIVALATDGLLPRRLGRVHARYGSPAAAVVTLGATGLAALIAAVLWHTESLLSVYSALATLIVYLWVVPYVLICVAQVVLLVRERRVEPVPLLAGIVGAAAMTWLYVNGFVNPPLSPVASMSYVALVLIAITLLALAIRQRTTARHAEPEPEPARDRVYQTAPTGARKE